MQLLSALIKQMLPTLSAEVARRLLNELRDLARSQVVSLVVKQTARIVTKGIDGLVKAFTTHLEPPDAHKLTQGAVDEFQRQLFQLAESLRIYADASYQVQAGLQRGESEEQIESLRGIREKLRREVEAEIRDVFSVLTGGTPED